MEIIVHHLQDVSTIDIPKNLTQWRINDSCINAQLDLLAKLYANEINVECVKNGDCVVCECLEGNLNNTTILIYPGLNLPHAIELEQKVIDCHVGDIIKGDLNGEVKLQIKSIVRKENCVIDNHFISSLDIENVNTVDEYKVWYKNQEEKNRKSQAIKEIENYLLDEITQNSSFEELNREEFDNFLTSQAKEMFEFEKNLAGDTNELTLEYLQELKNTIEFNLKREAVGKKICQDNGFTFDISMFKEEIKQLLDEFGGMEDMVNEYKEMFVRNAYVDKVYEILEERAIACLEV